MKNQRNNSSYSVDYNQLMIELRKARKNYEASTNYTDLMSLKHFCEKNWFTAQRIYLCKSNPSLWVNTINKLVTAWVDMKDVIIK